MRTPDGRRGRNDDVHRAFDRLGAAAAHLKDDALAYVCMDWRHMQELLAAGREAASAARAATGPTSGPIPASTPARGATI